MVVTIRVEGDVTPLINKLLQFRDEVMDSLQDGVNSASSALMMSVMETCPSPTSTHYPTQSTGRLRDSHVLEISQLSDRYQVVIRAEAPYGFYVHEGTINYPARPWMQETILEHIDDVWDAINTSLINFINYVFL